MANKRIVYSTDLGRHCPNCGEPVAKCRCATAESIAPGDGIVRLQRETRGRNGKPVTLITGLPLTGSELKQLAKQLKSQCGVGGSIDGGNIIIQGDKRDLLKTNLEARGYRVKLSSG